MPRLIWHLEELRVGQCYPNYYVARLAEQVRQGRAVRGRRRRAIRRLSMAILPGAERRFEHTSTSTTASGSGSCRRSDDNPPSSARQARGQRSSTRDIFRGVFAAHPCARLTARGYINHSLYFELKTFLHGLLVVEDSSSMAHWLGDACPVPRQRSGRFRHAAARAATSCGNSSGIERIDENETGEERAGLQ